MNSSEPKKQDEEVDYTTSSLFMVSNKKPSSVNQRECNRIYDRYIKNLIVEFNPLPN